jgi:hypothetical protein
MSDFVLDIRPDIASKQQTYDFDLEGKRYRFRFKYSELEDRHYFSLYDGEDVVIVSGIKVLLNVSLLRKEVDLRKPPGVLMALDTSGTYEEAGENDLGDRVQLVYTESS